MYIVTFYSYRGGVGRTLSLLNTAVQLAKRGRNVLVVDFDLEAPGISTFEFCESATNSKGIVDYICEYEYSSRAPEIDQFIQKCTLANGQDRVEFFLMSAGRQDKFYADNFHSIDWERLYADAAGFLMMENLKEQWRDFVNPDYVLIDSRTGHTDISGICTRQLPDAVVFTFFPNLQNLFGLSHVVREARQEANEERNRPIREHFLASNVPTSDDDAGILSGNLEQFRNAINYEPDQLNIVSHYESMALLNQEIFTWTKPNTRLAKEYVSLANSIVQGNAADRDGALAYISTATENVRKNRAKYADDPTISKMMLSIAEHHSKDGEIRAKLADLHLQLRNFYDATSEFELAMKYGFETPDMLITLSFLYSEQRRRDEAVSVLLKLAEKPSADIDVHIAIVQLIRVAPERVPEALEAKGVLDLSASERVKLAYLIWRRRELLPYVVKMFQDAMRSNSIDELVRSTVRKRLTLCKIAMGHFPEALHDYGERRDILLSRDIAEVFNYAMIEWALMSVPPRDMLEHVLALSESEKEPDANFAQCIAVTSYLLGDQMAATDWLGRARDIASRQSYRTVEFSCWSYLYLTIAEFLEELGKVQRFLDGGDETPAFMLVDGRFVSHPNTILLPVNS